jgi:diguanylate cyclase (GGDEF)-like protein
MALIRNIDGEIQMMNEACRLSLKIPITQPLIGTPITSLAVRWTFFDQNGALPEHGNPFELALAGGVFHNAEFELHFYDGSTGWVLFNATPIYNKAGNQIAALIVFADISELKNIESAERDQRILAEAYRDTAAILNSTVQLDTVLTLVLSNIEKIVSHDAAMVVLLNDQGEMTRAQFQGFLPEEEKMALDLCQRLIEIHGPRQDEFDAPKTIIISDILQTGRFSKENSFSSLRSFLQVPVFAKGELRGSILLASCQVSYFSASHLERLKAFTDQAMIAIENSRLYTEMQNLTLTDELTKIYNFRGLMDLGEREFDRARRFHHPLSIIFFDIDHFRNFNNLYSHAVGNQVLQQTAKLTKNCLRGVDLLTRYGGEEFVVVLPETDLNTAMQVAERIRQAIKNQKITTRFGLLGITISAGVAELTQDVPTLASLIDLANQAEHRAKREGRDQVR